MSRQNIALEVEKEDFIDELKPGTELMHGQYTIERFLAAGGFGITYLALDSLKRRVVIKECFPGNFCRRQNASVLPRSRAHQAELRSIVQLFSQEAMSLAKTKHPNIVGVHQVFEENNTAYMALDYVEGRDLLEILTEDRTSLTPELVEKYLVKALQAVKHIHELHILHRDIAPDNIIINKNDEPILIDFGAARENTNEKVTRMLSALRAVKDGYSPQEFYIAGSEQSPSCDLYSLAASFYHVITGDLPPDAQWRLSAVAAGDQDPYVPLAKKRTGYSPAFVACLDKALAILPRDRMQSADEWLAALKSAAPIAAVEAFPLNHKVKAQPATAERKSLMPAILGTTGLVAAAGVGIMLMTGSDTTPSTGDPGERETVASTETPANQGSQVPASSPVEATDTPHLAEAPSVDPQPNVPVMAETASVDAANATATSGPIDIDLAGIELNPVAPILAATDAFLNLDRASLALTIPEGFDAPVPRPLRTADFTVAGAREAQPEIDLTVPAPPVRAEPTVTAEVSPAPATKSDNATLSGVDFFVSMAKSQPELKSVLSGPMRAAPMANAPAPASEPSSIISSLAPDTPFTLSAFQPGVISSVSTDSPTWLTADTRILSINGQPVATNAQINANIAALASGAGSPQFDVTLGLESGLTGVAFERTLTVATEIRTLLLNGLSFVTSRTGDAWTTTVADVPAGSSFQVGDTLVSYAATWEDLDGPETLKTIIERDLGKGTSTFSFAVRRDGEIWIEAFNLTSLAN